MANLYNKAGLINIPVGYSDGFLYNIKPTDNTLGFRFDRASAATRVNKEGLIEQVGYFGPELVQNGNFSELGPELIINGDFATDSDWSKGSGWSISDGKANRSSATTNSSIRQYIPVVNGKTYKFSYTRTYISGFGQTNLYVKIDNVNYYTIGVYNSTVAEEHTVTGYFTAGFTGNLYWEVYGISDFTGSIDNVSVKEVDPNDYWTLGTGWSFGNSLVSSNTSNAYVNFNQNIGTVINKTYKITFTVSNYSSGAVQYIIGNAGARPSGILRSANGTYTEYITVDSSTVDADKFFIRGGASGFTGSVTNISVTEVLGDKPRIDYTDSLTSPSFLLEPQRTNSILYSNGFDNSAWEKGGNGVASAPIVSANQGISPDGTNNAFKIDFDLNGGTASTDRSRLTENFTNTLTTDYTFSFYAKAYSQSDVGKVVNFSADNVTNENFNFTLTSDWQRFTSTGQSNGNNVNLHIQLRGTFDTSDTASLLLFGFQAEAGSYATSYIPTAGSTVTRAAETCNGAGNASTFNDSEGVLYAEISALADDGTARRMSISDSTTSNRVVLMYHSTSNIVRGFVSSGGILVSDMTYTVSDTTRVSKIAFSYKQDNFQIWIDGVQRTTDDSGNTPTGLKELAFDGGSGSNDFYGKVKGVYVFNKALTDDELQQLTGPEYNSFAALAAAYNYTVI